MGYIQDDWPCERTWTTSIYLNSHLGVVIFLLRGGHFMFIFTIRYEISNPREEAIDNE